MIVPSSPKMPWANLLGKQPAKGIKGNPKGKKRDAPSPLIGLLFVIVGGGALGYHFYTHDHAEINAFIHTMFYPEDVLLPEHTSDDVLVIDDFLTAEECDELIKTGAPKLKISYQADVKGNKMKSTYRTSQSAIIPNIDTLTYRRINKRMASVSGYSMDHFQEMQIAKYANSET